MGSGVGWVERKRNPSSECYRCGDGFRSAQPILRHYDTFAAVAVACGAALRPSARSTGGVENHLVALAHACAYLDGGAEVAHLRDLADVGDAILHHSDTQPVLVEDDCRRRHDQRRRLARNLQVNQQ